MFLLGQGYPELVDVGGSGATLQAEDVVMVILHGFSTTIVVSAVIKVLQ